MSTFYIKSDAKPRLISERKVCRDALPQPSPYQVEGLLCGQFSDALAHAAWMNFQNGYTGYAGVETPASLRINASFHLLHSGINAYLVVEVQA